MAVGDFTIDATSKRSAGNMNIISGTVEIDTNATTSAILPNSYIVAFTIDRNLTDDDVTAYRAHINSSDFAATVANGSVHIAGTAGAPDVHAWTATYI
jgi:hypothetical protein|tara:strand:- start:5464 stop:5757 length:294 start_codon:yes stop_codon:yes gene_type:complete